MMQRRIADLIRFTAALCGLLILVAPDSAKADPPAGAVAAFNNYVGSLESRLARQHSAPRGFLAAADEARLRRGELVIENLTPAGTKLPGAMLHHWRGSAFVPGATAVEIEQLMKDFGAYPKHYAPQVLTAKILAQQGDHVRATMRVRQQHILTVVMDTSYDVTFARLDARHGYSLSRSTHIAEIDSPGTPKERALGASEEHGFLWRQNTYWSYEERDGGVTMQIESVTLTRSIPRGLGWAVGPFVESVPRESLEFTLRSTCTALRR
jgi:hypothetical protein